MHCHLVSMACDVKGVTHRQHECISSLTLLASVTSGTFQELSSGTSSIDFSNARRCMAQWHTPAQTAQDFFFGSKRIVINVINQFH